MLGGRGSRMGVAKHTLVRACGQSLLRYQIERMAPHFSRILLLAGDWEVEERIGRLVEDPEEFRGEGPLAGLLAALRVAETPWVALLAIDQPAVPAELYLSSLQGVLPDTEVVVPRDRLGCRQWTCGLFRKSLTGLLEKQMAQGVRGLKDFCALVPMSESSLVADDVFINLNTPEEAERAGWSLPSQV